MKKMIYLLLLGSMSMLTGCHDITVGYLFTEHAGYQIDTLEIYSITGRLEQFNQELNVFYTQNPDIQSERVRLREEYERASRVSNEYMKRKLAPLYEEQDRLYEEDPVGNADRIAELDELIFAAEDEWFMLTAEEDEFMWQLDALENELAERKEELGLSDSPGRLEEIAAELQGRIDNDVPFATSPIESVEGTEPLHYEVESVRSATPEAAARFREYVGVMGGGRIYVRQDVDAPAGNYTVSLRVFNEGRSHVLTDVFTFVLIP